MKGDIWNSINQICIYSAARPVVLGPDDLTTGTDLDVTVTINVTFYCNTGTPTVAWLKESTNESNVSCARIPDNHDFMSALNDAKFSGVSHSLHYREYGIISFRMS